MLAARVLKPIRRLYVQNSGQGDGQYNETDEAHEESGQDGRTDESHTIDGCSKLGFPIESRLQLEVEEARRKWVFN